MGLRADLEECQSGRLATLLAQAGQPGRGVPNKDTSFGHLKSARGLGWPDLEVLGTRVEFEHAGQVGRGRDLSALDSPVRDGEAKGRGRELWRERLLKGSGAIEAIQPQHSHKLPPALGLVAKLRPSEVGDAGGVASLAATLEEGSEIRARGGGGPDAKRADEGAEGPEPLTLLTVPAGGEAGDDDGGHFAVPSTEAIPAPSGDAAGPAAMTWVGPVGGCQHEG